MAKARRKKRPETLRPFKVTLTRLEPGQSASPTDRRVCLGRQTKLGGEPDWIQNDDTPQCEQCRTAMAFVAQIDSVEHISVHNPLAFDKKSASVKKLRGWMFGDVGMIYVFYCFNCSATAAIHQEY